MAAAAAAAVAVLLLAGPWACAAQEGTTQEVGPNFYASGLSAVDSQGREVQMSEFAGKVTLVANVASLCGYTDSNYKGLTAVWDKYQEYGLQVLAFPCNQFGQQEPATIPEIADFLGDRYKIQFPLFRKVDVNGEGQHPIFKFLKENAPPVEGQVQGGDVHWNFEKFLIDKAGRPVKRYSSDFSTHDVETDVYNELINPEHGGEL